MEKIKEFLKKEKVTFAIHDGHANYIVGICARYLRIFLTKNGFDKKEIEEFIKWFIQESFKSDYSHLLQHCMQFCEFKR